MTANDLDPNSTTQRQTLFAEVILPVPVAKLFTYRLPSELNDVVAMGSRVIVPFGRSKILTGIVQKIHSRAPTTYEAKYILEVLDHEPMVTVLQMEVLQWISDYYLCSLGEVLNVALPSGLKLSSQSQIQAHPKFDMYENDYPFSEKELLLINALDKGRTLTYQEARDILGVKNIHRWLKSLIQKDAIILYEEVKEKYRPKTESKIRLTPEYAQDKSQLEALFKLLEKRPKQTDILLKYLQERPVFDHPEINEKGVAKKTFIMAGLSASALQTLIKNQVLEKFDVVVSRFDTDHQKVVAKINLNSKQTAAYGAILQQFEEKDTVLLHGVTGSGKTEIYIQLIRQALDNGSQALYLLPEIALTTQIVTRLKKVFGSQLGVYHSKFSDNERVEVWQGILSGSYPLVIGVRSSVLLPFDHLGLIIVDEEHENSYKQYDPAPRYHARDVALVLAQKHRAKTVLGSATPSIETYHLSKQMKYGLVELDQRYGHAQLPDFELVRLKKTKKQQNDFSPELLAAMEDKLSNHEQVIIFQNRRGYAPILSCQVCGWIPECNHCAVSLTYHLYSQELRCHYCGYKEKMPPYCRECESTDLDLKGYGTEQLEESLKLLFPKAKVQRMDLDTTRRKYSYQTIIDDFEQRAIDILVGTQMVTKGLDFDHVSLVGVMDIDRIIHYPDFRSHEKAYQLITQVSGRAGRRDHPGLVIIQTNQTQHPLLQKIVGNDYSGLFDREIGERKRYLWPPFVRLIKLVIKSTNKDQVGPAAFQLHQILSRKLGNSRVLGPQEPMIAKIRNHFLMEIYIKLERDKVDLGAAKQVLMRQINNLRLEKKHKNINVVVDVDPY